MSGSLATNCDSNGNGLTALDYRKILKGFYPNPGIVYGGTVTGNSSLTYHVSATVAVIDRGSDGTRLVYFSGGDTPAVTAGDASNRRIDVIWLKANDPALDGGSKEVTLGVTQGTPSANPAVPALGSGQLALMEKLVQPGATNLSTGSGDNRSYNYAIPYGASIGRLGEWWDRRSFTGSNEKQKVFHDFPIRFTLPTDRMVEFVFDVCFSATSGNYIEWAAGFEVDPASTAGNRDSCLQGSVTNFVSSSPLHDASWETHTARFVTNLTKGTHTAYVASWLQNPAGVAPVFHYGANASGHGTFVGRRFQIFDRGVAK